MHNLFLEGLLLQASLIFALGAQNLFVLEAGIKGQYPLTISFSCFFCDLVLIMLGVVGGGTLLANYTQLKILIGVVGVLFLLHYGMSKIFFSQDVLEGLKEHKFTGLRRCIIMAFTFSLLNPHAYLDAFVLIGGHSAKYGIITERIALGLGAAFFSLIWFIALSHAPSLMKPFFRNIKNLKRVSTCSGIILIILSFRLGHDVFLWLQGPQTPLSFKAFSYPIPSGLLYSTILY